MYLLTFVHTDPHFNRGNDVTQKTHLNVAILIYFVNDYNDQSCNSLPKYVCLAENGVLLQDTLCLLVCLAIICTSVLLSSASIVW